MSKDKKLLLTLVRHGQSQANTYHGLGQCPSSPLTKTGEEQARKLSEYWKGEGTRFDHVFSSSAERAFRTGVLSCAHFCSEEDVTQHQTVLEIHRGDWDGKPAGDFFTPEVDKLRKMDRDWRAPGEGAESINEVTARMLHFTNDVAKPLYDAAEQDVSIAVFSHGMAIRCLLLALADAESDKLHFMMGNTAINQLSYDEEFGWQLLSVNDQTHLIPGDLRT